MIGGAACLAASAAILWSWSRHPATGGAMATTRTKTRKAAIALPPLPADAVLLALDVSSSAIGWCVYRAGKFGAAGLIAAPMSRPSTERIDLNTAEVGGLAEDYGITRVVMEWQSSLRAARCRNANGLAVLGQAQGAAYWELRRRGLAVDRVSEREWTRVNGWNVSKDKRAERVKLLCPEYRWAIEKSPGCDPGMDMADAIGLAIFRMSK